MARTVLAVTEMSRTGITAPAEADGDDVNGNIVTNSGKTMLVVRNADAANPHTVTFVTPGTVEGLAVADRTVSIPASATRYFGRFSPQVYGGAMGVDVDSSEIKLLAFEP